MESFVTNLIKRPFKFFMLCMVLYMASQSFIVGAFVTVVGLSFLYHRAMVWNKAVPAAPKVSMPDTQSKSKHESHQVGDPLEQPYERSAVVTPLRRAGTHDRS
ncbi:MULTISPECIES: hypothetical protein [Cupriavidus]|uniref:Uncharacterized protein n=1 Tax=Cupriavidus basilensis TaxID=68895 RepID=A0A643FR25_9BURK|nr:MULTISPECIES: hypothetical protein [Cupriavidus]KUE86415.1 hypothetical protein ASL20_23420 [Cupriavidus necator]NOV23616.1 hypothetical protein [Cupriavidus necator]QOT81688.1 hypothetical protein F7R26_037385 [Cupriavidus basilensis]BDB30096.1 hypothetical protein CTP10_R75130 [Cupriavidus sp. P-10]